MEDEDQKGLGSWISPNFQVDLNIYCRCLPQCVSDFLLAMLLLASKWLCWMDFYLETETLCKRSAHEV